MHSNLLFADLYARKSNRSLKGLQKSYAPQQDSSRTEVGKLFSRRAALTIQELAEDQCLKSCNSFIECKNLQ